MATSKAHPVVSEGRAASFLKSCIFKLCNSTPLSGIRSLWERNQTDSKLTLTKYQKAAIGLYLAARDWSLGNYPPRFDRETAWENECKYVDNHSGWTQQEVFALSNMKPYDIRSDEFEVHSRNFTRIRTMLRTMKLFPPARILELGCGQGWLSEMLAMSSFHVTGTSIAPPEIQEAQRRAEAFRLRNIPGSLTFDVSPMERVHEKHANFDAVFVYEALHHAFDWRETVHSVVKTLRPSGWFVVCDEPNVAHTLIAYRGGKLTNTHEIGISRRQLRNELRAAGFTTIISFSSPLHFWVRWHWMAAQLVGDAA